jgi:hypothetical protein
MRANVIKLVTPKIVLLGSTIVPSLVATERAGFYKYFFDFLIL